MPLRAELISSFTVDFVVHRNGDSDRPRHRIHQLLQGRPHSWILVLHRRAARTLGPHPPVGHKPRLHLRGPTAHVSADAPVAAAISLMPRRPNWRAPAPIDARRCRSSKIGAASASILATADAKASAPARSKSSAIPQD